MRQVKAFHLLLLYTLYAAGMILPSLSYQDSAYCIRKNSEIHVPHHSKSFLNTTGHASLLPGKYLKSSYPSGGKGKAKWLLSPLEIIEDHSCQPNNHFRSISILLAGDNRTDEIPLFLRNRALII
jgi:hypothetical protein